LISFIKSLDIPDINTILWFKMKKKILKPTSSHFLSQKFWRISRRYLSRNLWSYLYIISQKIKIGKNVNILKNSNLELKKNLNYPKISVKKKSKKKFSYYLRKFQSSKPEGSYRKFLDSFFLKLKYPNSILEFGISEGAGIYSMSEYYKNSKIWGCDIDKETFIKTRNITSGFCDQVKLSSINKILTKFKTKFDLIIDDGWHHPQSQINSIIASLPYLNNNGVYISEDIAHDPYKEIFYKVINILKTKGFKISYRTYHIENSDMNLAGTKNNGYLIIYRNLK